MIEQHKLKTLQNFSKLLQENNINHALGGSGLLYALGLEVEVNDWDLTTDAPLHQLKQTLENHSYKEISSNPNYASDYLLNIYIDDVEIDLIGNFAIRKDDDIIRINTSTTAYWHDVPLGCPKEWQKAYEVMNRPSKVELLNTYLKQDLM